MTKQLYLKIRVSADDLALWKAKAATASMSLSELLRQSLQRVTVRNRAADGELLRALSRLGSNLNQIAAWANSRRGTLEAVRVIPYLIDLERQVAELVKTREPRP